MRGADTTGNKRMKDATQKSCDLTHPSILCSQCVKSVYAFNSSCVTGPVLSEKKQTISKHLDNNPLLGY